MHNKLDVSQQATLLINQLQQQFNNLFVQYRILYGHIEQKITDWKNNTEVNLTKQNPFAKHENKLNKWQEKIAVYEELNELLVKDFKSFCQDARKPFDKNFWQPKLDKRRDNKKDISDSMFKTLLCNDWKKKLNDVLINWRKQEVDKLAQNQFMKLSTWLEDLECFLNQTAQISHDLNNRINWAIQHLTEDNVEYIIKLYKTLILLANKLEKFGLNSSILWEQNLAEFTAKNIQDMQRWIDYLTNDEGAKKIADFLGRMRETEILEKISVSKQSYISNSPVIDTNSKEEIVGLRLGKDIEHMLPSELALMADPETSELFDLKYIESKLMCFELQGTSFIDNVKEIDIEIKELVEDSKGPMILCIDTSGSMQGDPEYIAKAMTFYLGAKAKEEKRECYIINFSTNIETFELTSECKISTLIKFLSESFYGATDVAPALIEALKLLKKEKYNKADVLIISDFIMSDLPKAILDDINEQKTYGNRFNSLVVGNIFLSNKLKSLFDKEWVYNPSSKKINQILDAVESLM